MIKCGNRIPSKFFITQGCGQSDLTVHAGSYHLALRDAGIEKFNIMQYSSVLPKIAVQTERPEGMAFGEVVDTISSVATGFRGQNIAAGIAFGWMTHRKTGELYGGFVVERIRCVTACRRETQRRNKEYLEYELRASLRELYQSGYQQEYRMGRPIIIMESDFVKKEYGTALVAMCFYEYDYPKFEKISNMKPGGGK